MRTTLDIPQHLLVEVQRLSEAPTRREAVIIAMEDYLRRQRLKRVIAAAGELDFDVDPRALRDADSARLTP